MKTYVVEVSGGKSAQYMGRSGRLEPVPTFWRSISSIKTYLGTKQWSIGKRGKPLYNKDLHQDKTVVWEVTGVTSGLANTLEKRLTYQQFMMLSSSNKSRSMFPAGTAFKIRANGAWVSVGYHRTKFGKTWLSESALRSHITKDLDKLRNDREYDGARVYAYKVEENGGLTFISDTDIFSFYTFSPSGSERWAQFTRGSSSLTINGNSLMQKLLEKA